jgi:hypothetical protein
MTPSGVTQSQNFTPRTPPNPNGTVPLSLPQGGTAAVDRPLYTNHPRKTADSPTGLEIPAHNRFETYMQFMYFM